MKVLLQLGDPDAPLYTPPMTIIEACQSGRICYHVYNEQTDELEYECTPEFEKESVMAYCDTLESVLAVFQAQHLGDPKAGRPRIYCAHAKRLISQALWWGAMRGEGESMVDPERLDIKDLAEHFYRYTVMTMGERQTFGDMLMKTHMGMPTVKDWWLKQVRWGLL